MNIRDYYQNQFQADLTVFMPDSRFPYFGHSWQQDCRGLENIPPERRATFLICMYFTVLVDQAMHAHFRAYYPTFESLTRYPKFCHGLGQFQKNPRGILLYPIERGLIRQTEIEGVLNSGMHLFVAEVAGFFQSYMSSVTPQRFFDKLLYDPDVKIPLIVVLLNPDMQNDIEVKTYNALRKAVDEKYPKGKPWSLGPTDS